ncbi:hypothetical protein ACFL1H_05115, partial [Nanoarchaeota archaeon]
MGEEFSKILDRIKNIVEKDDTEIKDNFETINQEQTTKTISFIDGGNYELIRAPNFSLHYIRVYQTTYQYNKRIKSEKIEFYCLTTAKTENNSIIYSAELFNHDLPCSLIFEEVEDISQVGEIVRRLS